MFSDDTLESLSVRYEREQGNTLGLEDDLMRFIFVYRLAAKYQRHGETNVKLLINHMIILFNVFGDLVEPTFIEYMGNNAYIGSLFVFMQHEPDTYPHDKEFLGYLDKSVFPNK